MICRFELFPAIYERTLANVQICLYPAELQWARMINLISVLGEFMIFGAKFLCAFLTAWINNFISPINSLSSSISLYVSSSSNFLELLSLNTTSGPFRKLGRLYESCLRQQLNSSTIRLTIERLGGYLPINALGPSTVTPLLVKMMEMGAPLPLLDVYYDLSYGRKPQVLLIIDIPTDVHHLLQVWNRIWWA